ncbi:MAG TPA: response regulator [Thermoanaerobaculia bacterium]
MSSRTTIAEVKTVLVVDDDADFLIVMREVIEEERFRCLTARNGDEALQMLESGETPCLIILDLKMPGMDGPEFRRRQLLHPRIAKIPVVGFTGAANGEAEARRLALSSLLRKPVHLHQLLETVAHYCSDPDHIDSASRPTSAAG